MRSEHFTDAELRCRHCGENLVIEESLDRLENLRAAVGHPLRVTSAYRCPAYNDAIANTGQTGPHTLGQAFDLYVPGDRAFEVIRAAMVVGFTGIGIQQKGMGRMVHVDDCDDAARRPRPRIWTY